MTTTFPDALAALTSALGGPTDTCSLGAEAHASWGPGALDGRSRVLMLWRTSGGEVWLAACATVGSADTGRAWTLAGTPTADAPLPDAVAAAVAWLTERGVAVGGSR